MRLRIISPGLATAAVLMAASGFATATDSLMGGGSASGALKPAGTDWRHVESADYRNYVANLRTLGFPEVTVKAMVSAEVVTAFGEKRAAAVAARCQNFKYWRVNPAETEARAKLAAQRQAIDEEMGGVLQQLLGAGTDLPDVSREWQREEWNQELAFLTPAKLAATEVILEHYGTVNQQMKDLGSGLNVTEDTNVLEQTLSAYQEEKSTLRHVLSSEEYAQVEMTVTWTAGNLRHALVHFEPTETEFRIIFGAWQAHDEKLSAIYAHRQVDPGDGEVQSQLLAQLSTERYQQYRETWWK